MTDSTEESGNAPVAAAPTAPAANPLADAGEPKSVLWIVALITSLGFLGVYDVLLNAEPNACAMTYMYEYPEYIPVPLAGDVAADFPQYGLFVYGEGQFGERLRKGKFDGIPVLFVPGNSGSFKQVRSLASVALRKALDDDIKYVQIKHKSRRA